MPDTRRHRGPHPEDPLLIASDAIVATAHSVILDGCRRWTNLARHVIEHHCQAAHVVPMSAP